MSLEVISIILAIVVGVVLAYYVHTIVNKVTGRYFELRDLVEEYRKDVGKVREWVQEELRKFEKRLSKEERKEKDALEDVFSWKLKGLQDKLSSLDKELKELRGKLLGLENVVPKISELDKRINELNSVFEDVKKEVKEELKQEVLSELEEEIEKLETVIERRKDEELREFLDLLTIAIDLPPEKIRDGLYQAKRGLLSLRDIGKVYVLTGKGREEFEKLRENLVSLLKDLRKLAVIAAPKEEIYSSLTSVIVGVKRLKLPMEEGGKELGPEKSFIKIHRTLYELVGILDRVGEAIEQPVPVTPIEKEFYEKLRLQFEELKRLEKQVQELIASVGVKVEEEEEKDRDLKEIESILRDLGV
ncbi:hypothetical protein [Pyrococcus yayanosii]|uniref:DNA double-strand break repair Rad50 ATPase n=1 Tax=Pyrococcus yayanosii (strain CH1 / JCM 16557) TaxID=529709 RepID=F8AGR9_PYRYC|nr:hypothetical protein [Pyrococcus yayanosii]AEH25205.1 hypothetical protein PYCH_15390 [Pyrococcus yayanosii CH1]